VRRIDARRAGRVVAGLALFAAVLPGRAGAQQGADFDVPGGHFFTQTGGGGGKGYAVTDADGVGFWAAFQQVGGVEGVGYPVSQRFVHGGFVTQAMQKAVFQWRPETKSVAFVNVFDDLAAAGKDGFLASARQTPPAAPFEDGGRPFEEVVRIRQAALEGHPAMKAVYFGARDPVLQYGLPTSRVVDEGSAWVIRLQRAVIQEWKVDVPWAKAGQATVANGGDIAKEAGLFPAAALAPVEPGAALGAAAPAGPAAPAPAAPAPAAPAGQPAAPAAGGAPAPAGGLVLQPNQIPPYDTPIAGPQPEAGKVNVLETVRTRLGGDRIIGLIRNDTGGPVSSVKAAINGSDASGNTGPLLQADGVTYLTFMAPGEVLPFEAQASLVDPITYNVGTRWRPGMPAQAAYRDVQAQVTGTSRNNAGWLVVQGTVKNPTSAPRRNLSIVVGGYDAQGNLEDVGAGASDPPDLDPGQSGTFAVTLPANFAKATDFRVVVEAYDKSREPRNVDTPQGEGEARP
jgi:hypothetical protein